MVISHKKRYLFIEMPHTASTAISKELCELYDGEPILTKHSNYSEYLHSLHKTAVDYFVFAAVRNPLDQVVTEYSKMKSDHHGSFTSTKNHEERGGWVSALHLRKFNLVAQNASFAEYLKTFYAAIYHNSVLMGHDKFNFIMRFENIATDFMTVLHMLGITPVRPLPTVNKTHRREGFSEFYDPAAQLHAARVFGPFMKQWGYKFPQEWPQPSVPLRSRLLFGLQDTVLNHAGRLLCLSPRSQALQRIKRIVRR